LKKKYSACAIILARKNSVRLPNKNKKLFASKPLIFWTIEAALKSNVFDRIFCFTDDDYVKKLCVKNNVETIIKRPKKLSGSNISSLKTIKFFLDEIFKIEKYNPHWVTLLQPTSPLRSSMHIKESYSLLSKNKCDSLISVKKIKSSYNNLKYISNKKLKNIKNDKDKLKDIYEANGAIYTIKKDKIEKINSFITNNTQAYIMDDEASVDIDNIKEFKLAEKIFKINNE